MHWRDVGMAGPSAIAARSSTTRFAACGCSACATMTQADCNALPPLLRDARLRDGDVGASEPVAWAGADALDIRRASCARAPELYNLDAVAYESVMLGLFTMFRGERPEREKPNDICVGFSRDGFHWSRPIARRRSFAVSERQGDWNWANVQSAGGGCLVVGDQLYFYVSGRSGVPARASRPCSTGSPRFGATASPRSLTSSLLPLLVRSRPRAAP